MWCELFPANKGPLLDSIDGFMEELSVFRELLAAEDRDGMRGKMRLSAARRLQFDKPKL